MAKLTIDQKILQAVYHITLSENKNVTAYRISKILGMNVSYIYKRLAFYGVPNSEAIDTEVIENV